MPKINVYLPDALADAVREAQLPVSSICQAALESAVQQGAGRPRRPALRPVHPPGPARPRARPGDREADPERARRHDPPPRGDRRRGRQPRAEGARVTRHRAGRSAGRADGIDAAEDYGDRRQPGLRGRCDARARAHREGGDVARPQLHRLRAHPPRCPRDRGHDGRTGPPPHGRRHAQRSPRRGERPLRASCTPWRKRRPAPQQSPRSDEILRRLDAIEKRLGDERYSA